MMGTPTETVYQANGSSPTPAGQERIQYRTKIVPLNVDDSCMAEADLGTTGSGTRIYPYCLYWLFGTCSLWMDTLLKLDIVGKSLVLPQSNVSYPLRGMDGGVM